MATKIGGNMTGAEQAELDRRALESLSSLTPGAREERLIELTASAGFDVRTLVQALPSYPLPGFAVALHARITHPDFTTQLPDATRTKKAMLASLAAVGKRHPEVGAALRAAKKADRARTASLETGPGSDVATRIEALAASASKREPLVHGARHGKLRTKWANTFRALRAEVFGKWNHYPMLAWLDMSAEQRALAELELDAACEDWNASEAHRASEARRIGRAPAGPADTILQLERPRPLYCAVNDVAAALREPTPVIAAFDELDGSTRLGAWNEIARGIYGVDLDHSPQWKDSARHRHPFRLAFRERFCLLMAELSLRAGSGAREAAEVLATEALALDPVPRTAAVAAYTLVRHAQSVGVTLDEGWDPLLQSVLAAPANWVNPAIQARLLDHLPPERAEPLRAHLIVYPPG